MFVPAYYFVLFLTHRIIFNSPKNAHPQETNAGSLSESVRFLVLWPLVNKGQSTKNRTFSLRESALIFLGCAFFGAKSVN